MKKPDDFMKYSATQFSAMNLSLVGALESILQIKGEDARLESYVSMYERLKSDEEYFKDLSTRGNVKSVSQRYMSAIKYCEKNIEQFNTQNEEVRHRRCAKRLILNDLTRIRNNQVSNLRPPYLYLLYLMEPNTAHDVIASAEKEVDVPRPQSYQRIIEATAQEALKIQSEPVKDVKTELLEEFKSQDHYIRSFIEADTAQQLLIFDEFYNSLRNGRAELLSKYAQKVEVYISCANDLLASNGNWQSPKFLSQYPEIKLDQHFSDCLQTNRFRLHAFVPAMACHMLRKERTPDEIEEMHKYIRLGLQCGEEGAIENILSNLIKVTSLRKTNISFITTSKHLFMQHRQNFEVIMMLCEKLSRLERSYRYRNNLLTFVLNSWTIGVFACDSNLEQFSDSCITKIMQEGDPVDQQYIQEFRTNIRNAHPFTPPPASELTALTKNLSKSASINTEILFKSAISYCRYFLETGRGQTGHDAETQTQKWLSWIHDNEFFFDLIAWGVDHYPEDLRQLPEEVTRFITTDLSRLLEGFFAEFSSDPAALKHVRSHEF